MRDPADLYLLRIRRGKDQLRELLADMTEFGRNIRQGESFEITPEKDLDSSKYVHKLRVLDAPPYERWGVFIGEIVHNARSPLDQIICALCMSNNTKPDRKTAFPVFDDPDKYKFGFARKGGPRDFETSGARKVKGVGPNVLTEIEGLQPYHKHATGRGLFLLDQLWRVDKHLVPIGGLGRAAFRMGAAADYTEDRSKLLFVPEEEFPYETGARAATSDNPVKVHLRFAFEVHFKEGPPWESKPRPFGGLPVAETLTACVQAAEDVVGKIAPFATWSPYG
jgi:hypothetical protein